MLLPKVLLIQLPLRRCKFKWALNRLGFGLKLASKPLVVLLRITEWPKILATTSGPPVRFRGGKWTERLPVRFEWLAAAWVRMLPCWSWTDASLGAGANWRHGYPGWLL